MSLVRRPSHALRGDVFSPVDSGGIMPEMPHSGGRATTDWAPAAPRSLGNPVPMEEDNPSSPKSNATNRPGDRQRADAQPSQRVRTDFPMAMSLGRYGADVRDCFRLIPYDSATARGTVPVASTSSDIAHALRNPLVGRPAREVTLPVGNSRIPAENPFPRCAFGGQMAQVFAVQVQISPRHYFARCPDGPGPVALEAVGAAKVSPREVGMLNGARELEPLGSFLI